MNKIYISFYAILLINSCRSDGVESTICESSHQDYFFTIKERKKTIGVSTIYEVRKFSKMIARIQLDDDVEMAAPKLAIWNEWVFAANGDTVWGGFNKNSREIFGEHQWSQLPITTLPHDSIILCSSTMSGRTINKPSGWNVIRKNIRQPKSAEK